MILVDTSVWINHLRFDDAGLVALLNDARVLTHPFVIGELACGNLRNRNEVLTLLAQLPQAAVATDAEVLSFIEHQRLMGRGIGYIDAHLLTSVKLANADGVWTRDKSLRAVATTLKLAWGRGMTIG